MAKRIYLVSDSGAVYIDTVPNDRYVIKLIDSLVLAGYRVATAEEYHQQRISQQLDERRHLRRTGDDS